ncbi:DHA2 family efflux MFS transporter permease subunit [Candidatus Entotheonella palauensis]|uniref:DHA2 family efflux MFS transporter permease subunit n=1 Tax=Candidatus Entotheonella palauensis TaxID=93172 RepID=UPI000B7D3ACC|nr:DHA2 family efflux MFS transporter permease subunit [Candidatus Entotheonella palauensis]
MSSQSANPSAEDPPSHLQSSRWVLAFTILIGQVTLAFSMFAVAVALPKIMSAMSADVTNIHWVMTGFQIARTVPMPAMGWCSSLIGPRRLYLVGLATTVLSTICCGLAWNLESLIFFRVLQGVSAAPAQVMGMVILYQAFPAGQRGLILGLLLFAGSLGPTIGPSLGGYLVQTYSWRAMFYLSLPTAVLSLMLAPLVLPKTEKPPRPAVDAGGLLSMTIWVVALLLAVTQGQRHGWDSFYIRSLLVIAGVFFAIFVALELMQKQPFVELRLYRNPRFVIASVAGLFFEAAFNSANFLVALMLQRAFHYTPLQAGLLLAPGAVLMGLSGIGAGRLADLRDPRWSIILGLALQAAAMYGLGSTSLVTPAVTLLGLIMIYRMSFGCVHSPLTNVILRSLPPDRLNVGSGLDGIHRGFASAFGIALGSTVLERCLSRHQIRLGEQHDISALSVQDATSSVTDTLIGAVVTEAEASGRALSILLGHLREQAQIAAYQDTFLVLFGVTLLAVIPALLSRARSS